VLHRRCRTDADGDELEPLWASKGDSIDVLVQTQTGIPFGAEDGFAVTQTWSGGAGHVVFFGRNEHQQALLVIATADGIRSSIIGGRGLMGT